MKNCLISSRDTCFLKGFAKKKKKRGGGEYYPILGYLEGLETLQYCPIDNNTGTQIFLQYCLTRSFKYLRHKAYYFLNLFWMLMTQAIVLRSAAI